MDLQLISDYKYSSDNLLSISLNMLLAILPNFLPFLLARLLHINNIKIKDSSIVIDYNQAKSLKMEEVCILCTGSQGKPLAALSRIANGVHKQITLMPDESGHGNYEELKFMLRLIKPNITTRGFVLVNEIVNNSLNSNSYSYTDLRNQIILELHPFINELTGRHPIIIL